MSSTQPVDMTAKVVDISAENIIDITDDCSENTTNYESSTCKSLPSDFEQNNSPAKEDMTTTLTTTKTKHADIGIYRPPSLRSGDGTVKSKLNVHAKEFVMGGKTAKSKQDDDNLSKMKENAEESYASDDTKSSGNYDDSSKMKANADRSYAFNAFKSSGNDDNSVKINVNAVRSYALNASKSSSTIFTPTRVNSSKFKTNGIFDLQRVKSSGNVLLTDHSNNGITGSKVQFKVPYYSEKGDHKTSPKKTCSANFGEPLLGSLKRSKSLNADDSLKQITLEATLKNFGRSFADYDLFPEKIRSSLKQAVEHTERMKDKNKIILGRTVVQNAIKDKKLASPAAKFSIIIMDKDTTGAYHDSLLNTCQMLYQTKKTQALANPKKFAAFLEFLQALYIELKSSKSQLKVLEESIVPPKTTFLNLIARCCEDILTRNDVNSVADIECLFHALANHGRDIEIEAPNMFKKLFNRVREVLLLGRNGPEVQKILLQLLELRAAHWQLPISALSYYYPKVAP